MKRPWQIWTAYCLCLGLVLAAMIYQSQRALELDEAQRASQQQAQLEENARLALWRMDSLMGSLVAQENSRPYFVYSAYYPAERAYGKMFNWVDLDNGNRNRLELQQAHLASPILQSPQSEIELHFQCDPAGKWTSPQAPTGSWRKYAVGKPDAQGKALKQTDLDHADQQLKRVEALIQPAELLASLPATLPDGDGEPIVLADNLSNSLANNPGNNGNPNVGNNGDVPQQQQTGLYQSPAEQMIQQRARANNEYGRRSAYVAANTSTQYGENNARLPAANGIHTAVMQPRWIGDELLLVRKVTIDNREFLQGCLLAWPAIKQSLLSSIVDLLPNAELEPVKSPSEEKSRMLAALPIALTPGELNLAAADEPLSPLRLSLFVAWGCLVLAAVAVAALLHGVMTLSERRGAFVSAVTHELRTPLTTFRMYAEMLAEGMVPDEETRRRYLTTLTVEADRLTHLVANVLAYARLERGRPGGRLHATSVAQIIDSTFNRLSERAEQADFELSLEATEDLLARQVLTDATAVEQILFNLVDNACKYAVRTGERRLELHVSAAGRGVALALQDHGPGIARCERRRLFQPFHKSVEEAAQTAPGVGLGLALCRRLARDMGGDLQLDAEYQRGARFVLTLPPVRA